MSVSCHNMQISVEKASCFFLILTKVDTTYYSLECYEILVTCYEYNKKCKNQVRMNKYSHLNQIAKIFRFKFTCATKHKFQHVPEEFPYEIYCCVNI